MPMFALTTSVDIAGKEDALKVGLGKAVALLPGKSEAHLMISLAGNTAMYLAGERREAAFLDVSCFGRGKSEAYDRMTGAVCDLLREVLGIDPGNVYVKYSETGDWGWNGRNF